MRVVLVASCVMACAPAPPREAPRPASSPIAPTTPPRPPYEAAVCYAHGDPVAVQSCYVLRECTLSWRRGSVNDECPLDDCGSLKQAFDDAAREAGLELKPALLSGASRSVTIRIGKKKATVDAPGARMKALYAMLNLACPKGPPPP